MLLWLEKKKLTSQPNKLKTIYVLYKNKNGILERRKIDNNYRPGAHWPQPKATHRDQAPTKTATCQPNFIT